MKRATSVLAEGWWDFTTLDEKILHDASQLTEKDLCALSRPGFKVVLYDTLESFYMNEALEYLSAWEQATPSRPAGICGPIGPTEQLPLVAELVNTSRRLPCAIATSGEWMNGIWMEKRCR